MYKWEKTLRGDSYRQQRNNPSFSSSLLDEIYRSTDDGAGKSPNLKFYRETMNSKQSKSSAGTNKAIGDEHMSSLRRASLVEKWIDKRVSKEESVKQRMFLNDYERKLHLDHDHDQDQDALFFSSTSGSSDSSSGGLSSSDSDSLYGSRSRPSCFVPSRPKPVRTSIAAARPEKLKKTERTLFYKQRELHMFDEYHYHYNSATTENTPKLDETHVIKSKSRALKIYSNLNKVKQPISPGRRLANFIHSLFTSGNAKKKNNSSSLNASYDGANTLRSTKSGQVATCSSAASFSSRSCLINNSPSTRERLRNGDKRSVRFYPLSVIVDEDCRPCGHKCLSENEGERVGEIASEFFKYYHQNQKKNDDDDDDDDDDAASCSSSDLFELDHLNVMGNNVDRHCEELPVYETTHVDTNRAIANGLIM